MSRTKWVSLCFPGGQLDQSLVLFVRERRVQHFLQRLDLARQATVLAVDEHGDQGRIWLGYGNDSLVVSSVKTLHPQGP